MTDFGCGTGELTPLLLERLPNARIRGVDLSPNYLSMAEYKRDALGLVGDRVEYLHGNVESVDLDQLQDVVLMCYAFHEMPVAAIRNTLSNALRWLRPDGGQVVVVDMNPKKLPRYPAFIDLSEPHLREYRTVSFSNLLVEAGFVDVSSTHLHNTSYLFSARKCDG